MYQLIIQDEIASAQYLRGYEGKCKNLHGHTFKIEVTVQGEQLNRVGMVMDFKDLKRIVADVLEPLDHACLNDLEPFKEENPTAEHIAKYVYHELLPLLVPIEVVQVRVWESERASAIYRAA